MKLKKRPKVSFAIIAKNEHNSLPLCLESIKKNAEGLDYEIVVCDTGSEDDTVEVAKKYTDKVFTDYKWDDDFAGARNHCNSKCLGEWIFVIDSDCELACTGEDIKKEIELAEKDGNQSVQVECHEKGGITSHWIPLCYKNDPKIFWSGRAHNYLSCDSGRKDKLRIDYWSSDSHQKDPNRTLRILKKVVEEKPDVVREKFYLAREYWYRSDYVTAVHWYKKYLAVAYWGPEMVEAYFQLAKSYWGMKEWELAKTCCLQSIGLNPNFKEAILWMAGVSGPGGKKRWEEFAKTATNEGVLFIRVK